MRTQKEVAALAFPNLNGRLDYHGFKADKDPVVKWPKAVYIYYWEKATSQIPDQLSRD